MPLFPCYTDKVIETDSLSDEHRAAYVRFLSVRVLDFLSSLENLGPPAHKHSLRPVALAYPRRTLVHEAWSLRRLTELGHFKATGHKARLGRKTRIERAPGTLTITPLSLTWPTFATSSSAAFPSLGTKRRKSSSICPDRRPPKDAGKRKRSSPAPPTTSGKNMTKPAALASSPAGLSKHWRAHPVLRTRRPVTYTVSVDCIPPCQPGLNFPPHAVRLASPHAGSCGSQAVTRYRRRLAHICDARWPSRRRSIVGTPLENWVDDAARLTKPDRVVYCDGSAAENERVVEEMLREGDS